MDIFKLQTEVWKIAESKGWHEGRPLAFGEFIALCHSELSEALEFYRKKGNGEKVIGQTFFEGMGPVGVPIELADVIIRILDYCETHGINMQEAIDRKCVFNETREHRHGGKVI